MAGADWGKSAVKSQAQLSSADLSAMAFERVHERRGVIGVCG